MIQIDFMKIILWKVFPWAIFLEKAENKTYVAYF